MSLKGNSVKFCWFSRRICFKILTEKPMSSFPFKSSIMKSSKIICPNLVKSANSDKSIRWNLVYNRCKLKYLYLVLPDPRLTDDVTTVVEKSITG